MLNEKMGSISKTIIVCVCVWGGVGWDGGIVLCITPFNYKWHLLDMGCESVNLEENGAA